MVVKHPRGEHANGMATVRGGSLLDFEHELCVHLFKKRCPLFLFLPTTMHERCRIFLFCFFCPFLHFVFVAYPVWWVQEYTEEFREIAPRSKKNLGGVADGNITLINQRSVCDDLPVCTPTYLHPPLMPVII